MKLTHSGVEIHGIKRTSYKTKVISTFYIYIYYKNLNDFMVWKIHESEIYFC